MSALDDTSVIAQLAAPVAIATCIYAVSAVIGSGWLLLVARGEDRRRLAPALGLALVISISTVAFAISGDARAAVIAVSVLAAACAGVLAWRRTWVGGLELDSIGGALLSMAVACTPFFASARVGIYGVGLNNDTAPHMYWVLHLDEVGALPRYVTESGYPTGPHHLMAAAERALSFAAPDTVLVAMMLASCAVMATTALAALTRVRRWLRWAVAALVPSTYLVAGYIGQGAFKEPLAGAFVLALGVVLGRDGSVARPGWGRRVLHLLVLVLALYLTIGASGIAWPVGGLGVVFAFWVVRRRRSIGGAAIGRRTWAIASGIAVACFAAIAVALPQIRSSINLVRTLPQEGGNIGQDLHPFEVLGVWLSRDFRYPPSDQVLAGALGALVTIAFVWAVVRAIRRDDLGVVSIAVAALTIYAVARPLQSPYWVAKLLVIAAPAAMLVLVRGWFEPSETASGMSRRIQGTLAALFVALALVSSIGAYSSAQVDAPERIRDLAPIRDAIGTEPVLFLGQDNFIGMRLRSIHVANPFPYSQENAVPLESPPTKTFQLGALVDFDSITSATLDRFKYVVAVRTRHASAAPDNFERVQRTRYYDLYRRSGPTAERIVPDETDDIVGQLECDEVDSTDVHALVRDRPFDVPAAPWRRADGSAPTFVSTNVQLGAGELVEQELTIPGAGAWDLSMQYQSSFPLEVTFGDERFWVPAQPDTMGQRWLVGTIDADASRSGTLRIRVLRPPFGARGKLTTLGYISFASHARGQRVDGATACGELADWATVG